MKIGIDVDDTITDSWKCVIPYYSRKFNIPEETLHKSKPYYDAVKDKISFEEYYKQLLPIYDEVSPNVNILDHVKETIDKLYEMGHKVYFITSRGRDHTDPYGDTKVFLDRYHVKYDKIITHAFDKAKICKEEDIGLFIDDSYKHCRSVSELGIPVLMHETYYNKEYDEFIHFDDWSYVYEYVKVRWNNG